MREKNADEAARQVGLAAALPIRRATHFLASSLEISSSVRPRVSGTQRMTNTSRTKLMAAYRNIMFGTPTFSGEEEEKTLTQRASKFLLITAALLHRAVSNCPEMI